MTIPTVIPKWFRSFGAALAFACATPAFAANPIPNPGFENGTEGWEIKDTMSKPAPEAAYSGSLGLRVTDADKTAGSSAQSAKFPVTPGQELRLTFWARSNDTCAAVYFFFGDAQGRLIKDPAQRAGAGSPVVGVSQTDGQWHSYTLKAKAPEAAQTVAAWIHTFGAATGVADFDDFALEGIAENAAAIHPTPTAAKPTPAAPVSLPARAKPPIVVIKVDDLKPINGQVHGLWKQLTSFLEQRNIKAGIGIIAEGLESAPDEYCNWIKQQQASGRIEFWFHGWDHATHTVDGKTYNEFNNRPVEEQARRFAQSQKSAREKLGFPFHTFGPPGGVSNGIFDANTVRVMAEDPDMTVWLYSQPLDAQGKTLQAAGKVTILDRVWAVNIEGKVGVPDYDKFVAGYAQNPDRDYFVLQGHPMHWAAERFQNFVKIIDFLTAQGAIFMTPQECAAALKIRQKTP